MQLPTLQSGTRVTHLLHELESGTINIPANTELTIIAVLKKGWEGIRTLNFNFEGEQSTLHFFAYTIGKNSDQFTLRTNSNHHKGHTNAYYTVRSAMSDKSQIDYLGQLNIHPQAQVIDTHLGHHTLLLSPHAKAKTTPSLEIEADDVKAGHSASIGNLDQDVLFYLKSRGLNEETAKDLMIKGFIQADIAKIDDENIRQQVANELTDF